MDEVSKSTDDKHILTQICGIIDKFGAVDVLESSLSTKYTQDLLTGRQRKIKYVVLPPLLQSNLLAAECMAWTGHLIQ